MKSRIIILYVGFITISGLLYSCKKYNRIIVVETGSVLNINASGADVDAFVIDVGESGLSEHGWCIGVNPFPTISDLKINNGFKDNYGAYSNKISGLEPNVNYYIRSYISGSGVTYYGEQLEIKTTNLLFNISSPKSNDLLGIGLSYDISWSANINDKLKLDLFKGAIFYKSIISNIENNGIYSWSINSDIIDGNDYTIVISSIENKNLSSSSNVFSINHTVPPKIITGEGTNIEYFGAQITGNIEHFGTGLGVNQHGHCWSTNENPTISDNITSLGIKNAPGNFVSSLINLSDNTTYYVKAYATNSNTTIYGAQKIIKTKAATIPTVTSSLITNLSYAYAFSGGEVTNENGYAVIARGVCWSTSPNPTIDNNKTIDGSGLGVFNSQLLNLKDNTIYYLRAYASNIAGISYGVQKTFTTLQFGSVSDYDGNSYKPVQIGNQLWFAENLKVTHYSDGTSIPLVSAGVAWANLGDNNIDKAYCYLNNNLANEANTYGALYTWAAAMNGANSSSANPSGIQGVCPTGWHLPSDAEWKVLIDFIGGTAYAIGAGGKLKEAGLSHWKSYNDGATNEFGFTALPGGYRFYQSGGGFSNPFESAYFWTSTEKYPTEAYCKSLYYGHALIVTDPAVKSIGNSVRCIKN